MHRIHLTPEQADELHRRTRAAALQPRTRDRLEMVRLCAAGYRVAAIARLLRYSPQRVRGWLRRFRDGGFDALPDRPMLAAPAPSPPGSAAPWSGWPRSS